jgi:serine acetyltransferase
MNINIKNTVVRFLLNHIQHYNHKAYWKMREEVVNPHSKKPKWLRIFYLYRIKRMDAFNNASMGTDLGRGANFCSPPLLFHGLNGIIISHFASIGKNCTIMQQVTIAEGKGNKAPTIGNNCFLGAGCKIIGDIRVGDNVKIGANAVVVKDVPDGATAVGVPARIILKDRGDD